MNYYALLLLYTIIDIAEKEAVVFAVNSNKYSLLTKFCSF